MTLKDLSAGKQTELKLFFFFKRVLQSESFRSSIRMQLEVMQLTGSEPSLVIGDRLWSLMVRNQDQSQ